jgi:hypothetical protein
MVLGRQKWLWQAGEQPRVGYTAAETLGDVLEWVIRRLSDPVNQALKLATTIADELSRELKR